MKSNSEIELTEKENTKNKNKDRKAKTVPLGKEGHTRMNCSSWKNEHPSLQHSIDFSYLVFA